jgi:hypothetical protein
MPAATLIGYCSSSGDEPAFPNGDPACVQEDAGVRGAGGGLLAGAVAAAAAIRVVRDHVPGVRRHPAVRDGVRCRPAGQAGQQRQECEAAADLLQLVLYRAGALHRGRVHRHRVHPAGQGLGRRLRCSRRVHGHRARAVPRRLSLLPHGTSRPERSPRARAGARRQLQEPPRALAAGYGRPLLLLQQSRVHSQDSNEDVRVPEPGVRAREPRQHGAHPRQRAMRPVEAVHGAAGGERKGRRPRAADLVDGDHARRDHRSADVPRAAGKHDGAAGGPVPDPRGLLRRLQHPHAHRLGRRVRQRAGAASVAAHGPRARTQPAPAHGHREHPPRGRHRRGPPRLRPAHGPHRPHVGHAARAAALPHGARRCAQPHRPDRVLLRRVPQDHVQHRGVAAGARLGVRRRAGQRNRRRHRRGYQEVRARRVAGEQPQQGTLRLLLSRPHGAVRGQRGVLPCVRLVLRRGGAEQGCGGRRRGRCPGRAAAQSDY